MSGARIGMTYAEAIRRQLADTVPAPPHDGPAFAAGLLFRYREWLYDANGGMLPRLGWIRSASVLSRI